MGRPELSQGGRAGVVCLAVAAAGLVGLVIVTAGPSGATQGEHPAIEVASDVPTVIPMSPRPDVRQWRIDLLNSLRSSAPS